ncbi:MAG: T9SS type A sorting domain-containing protein [Cytophagaceae bacterium]
MLSFTQFNRVVWSLIILAIPFFSQGQVCPPTLAGNLVSNGNFENCVIGNLANDGFTSQYTYNGATSCPGGGGSVGPGGWSVTTNAPSVNSYFTNPTVPTGFTGGGNFLIIDADGTLGKDAWKSTVNVIAGTTYFFSAWASNINGTFENPPKLKFSINNVQLGADILTSSTSHNWEQFYVVWTAPSTGPVDIRLENLITTSNGNDVAIDEINFSTSCQYIPNINSLGQSSLMPSTVSTCNGGGTALLDPQLPGSYGIQWKNAALTNIGTTPTLTVSTPGRYYLCYSYINGCPRTDTVDVVNNFNIELGPNIELCNPASVTLATGVAVPPATIVWSKDGTPISGQTGPNLYVNTAGTYRVDVTAPGCTPANDQVVVTNKSVTPINATYCPTQNVTLSVSPNNGGQYKWWSAATGGTLLQDVGAGGENYTFSASTTTGYTFYVEDASSFAGTVGATSALSNFQGYYNISDNYTMAFTANQDFELLGLSIPVYYHYIPPAGTQVSITIEILQNDGSSFSPVKTFSSTSAVIPSGTAGNTLIPFSFTGFNILSSWGPNLRMKLSSISFTNGAGGYPAPNVGTTAAFPYNSNPAGVVSINGGYRNTAVLNTTDYNFFYNWSIQAGTPCARIPVQAIYSCPTPVTWLYVRGNLQSNGIHIQWATTHEENNNLYIVERSIDNLSFETIATVAGQGNSSTISTYSILDNSHPNGTLYYRVKQVDIDGTYSYSSIIVINDKAGSLVIYPNPSSNTEQISIRVPYAEEAWKVIIYGVNGQEIWSDVITESVYALPSNRSLATGVYLVKVFNDSKVFTEKLFIK